MRVPVAVLLLFLHVAAGAQTPPAATAAPPAAVPTPTPLFQSHEPLVLQLRTDLRTLVRDKGEKRVEHGATLQFQDGADTGSIKVELRTRGIFRLKECAFPPLRVDLPARKVEHTPFAGQDKLKLVTHCMSFGSYERQLLREYALYRAFNALTDSSFRVRLARITYVDSVRGDTTIRYGFLIESDHELARRLGGGAEPFENDSMHYLRVNQGVMTLIAVFQYFIGNTDWSVPGRHNIALFRRMEPYMLLAVPYDFDFAGAVGAPYASPALGVPIKSVRERYYRGFCQPELVIQIALDRFKAAKDSIYAAVQSVTQLSEGDRRGLLNYFNDFYSAIENRGMVQRDFLRNCRPVPQ
jgi:hypothetical protein